MRCCNNQNSGNNKGSVTINQHFDAYGTPAIPFSARLICLVLLATIFSFSPISGEAQSDPLSPDIQPPRHIFSGDWVDEIEIEMVGQDGAIKPSLSIRHDKNTANGPLGQSYRLHGLGVITQTSASGGVMGYTTDSQFRLNGAALVPVVGVEYLYTTATADGSRITYDPDLNVWVVIKDGWTFTYGSHADTGQGATSRSSRLSGGRLGSIPVVIGEAPLPGRCDDTCVTCGSRNVSACRLKSVHNHFAFHKLDLGR